MMRRQFFVNIALGGNCLLLFLALSGNEIAVPAWLQVGGRIHPLILHFPIVLMAMAVIQEFRLIFKNIDNTNNDITKDADTLLLSAALTAALTALSGFLLSQEEGYDKTQLWWHQWTGVSLSILSFAWYSFRNWTRKSVWRCIPMALVSAVSLILAGHYGASLTHGANFLLEPVTPENKTVLTEIDSAVIYTSVIQPIFEKKCKGCHNSNKAKGQLVMETPESLIQGGKNGPLWDAEAPFHGLMMQRIFLPDEEKKHMPPSGKTQLTETEKAVLYQWIKNGANFNLRISDLTAADTLRLLSEKIIKVNSPDEYDFKAADEAVIKKLNSNYRIIQPVSLNAPALSVSFFGASFFNEQQLKDLEPIKNQIVQLNLNRMPVTDKDLPTISGFKNLRHLQLSFTKITGATLNELLKLPYLKTLALSGTQVNKKSLECLKDMKALRTIYLWNTALNKAESKTLQQDLNDVIIESGFSGDTIVAKLSPPLIKEDDNQIFKNNTTVFLRHYVKGAEIRYTLDGSNPDSIKSKVYGQQGILIEKSTELKAKAFLPEWMSSDIISQTYYKHGYIPDSVQLMTAPNPQYTVKGNNLFDSKKGDLNFKSGKWLGYKENQMVAICYFNESVSVSQVTISTLTDIGSYIMPPLQLEVWGGQQPNSMTLLKTIRPVQPKSPGPSYLKGYDAVFDTKKVRIIKIIGKPLPVLPAWHPGKGDKGWLFIDEIFIN